MTNEPTDDDIKTEQIRFQKPGRRRLLITDNIRDFLSVRTDRAEITDVTIGDGVSAIQDDCFRGFSGLMNVNGGANCEYIGENAFRDCTKLSACDMVGNAGTTMTFIGQRAFANTALERVRLDLQGMTYAGGVQNEAFASCYSLTSVEMVRSSLIPQNGFKDCSSLVEATFPNQTSYVYDGCFTNNVSLGSFRFPSRIWGIGGEMFRGCTKLSSVTVDDTDDNPSIMRTVGPNTFSGCVNLTSFALPRSITSLSQIDPAFLSGSSIRQLYLNGLDDSVFKDAEQTVRSDIATDKYGYVTKAADIYAAYTDAVERGIPMVVITNYRLPPESKKGCYYCQRLDYFLNRSDWAEFMKKYKNVCYFLYGAWVEDSDLVLEMSFGHSEAAEKRYGRKFTKFPRWFTG